MPLVEERARSLLLNRVSESFFSIQTYSTRQCVELYRGCQFDCAYCFAASYGRESLEEQQNFGSRIEVHVDAPYRLEQELVTAKKESSGLQRSECTYLGAITDSYQPIERKYRLTRESLKVFLKAGRPVTVLTKSDLCLRDLDLWVQLAQRNLASIGFTLTMPSNVKPSVKQTLEPIAPQPSSILRAIESFVEAGVKTYVFVEPILPHITDSEPDMCQLVREIANTGNKKVHFGVLKLRPTTWYRLRSRLVSYETNLICGIEALYFRDGAVEFGDSWLPDPDYRHQLYSYLRAECESAGLGFSCEGGDFNLWLDDWATVQDPHRHPTGYNLWEIIKRHNSDVVTLPEMLSELHNRFEVLTPAYVAKLSELWQSGSLFVGCGDIGLAERDSRAAYYYKKETVPLSHYDCVSPMITAVPRTV